MNEHVGRTFDEFDLPQHIPTIEALKCVLNKRLIRAQITQALDGINQRELSTGTGPMPTPSLWPGFPFSPMPPGWNPTGRPIDKPVPTPQPAPGFSGQPWPGFPFSPMPPGWKPPGWPVDKPFPPPQPAPKRPCLKMPGFGCGCNFCGCGCGGP